MAVNLDFKIGSVGKSSFFFQISHVSSLLFQLVKEIGYSKHENMKIKGIQPNGIQGMLNGLL
jgi:hypothetical protein